MPVIKCMLRRLNLSCLYTNILGLQYEVFGFCSKRRKLTYLQATYIKFSGTRIYHYSKRRLPEISFPRGYIGCTTEYT